MNQKLGGRKREEKENLGKKTQRFPEGGGESISGCKGFRIKRVGARIKSKA